MGSIKATVRGGRLVVDAATHGGWRSLGRRFTIRFVTDAAKKLMEEALALPADERRRLGLALLESADEPQSGLSDAWKHEIGHRLERLQSGEVETVPGTEVEARVRASIERARQTHADD